MEHGQPSKTVAEWACGALHAAAPLASHLFDVASSWSVPKQRKGSQLAPSAARQALCNFVGSPCGLFESPDATLRALFAGVATSQAGRRLRVVSLRGVRRTAEQRRLEALAVEHGWEVRRLDAQQLASERSVDVLLLPHSRTAGLTLLAVAEPSLALWFSAEERAAAAWATESNRSAGHYSLHLYPGQQWEAAAAASLAAAEAAAAAASTPTKGRKRARSRVSVAVGRPRHGVALLWRSAGCASPPYAFDAAGPQLGPGPATMPHPSEEVEAAAAAAAGRAVSAGIPFSEWFACAALAPIAPLVRQLFVVPRRAGKSVWEACFEGTAGSRRALPRVPSPCLWLCGNHARGESFVDQVLSSPEVLLARMSAALAAARRHSAEVRAAPPLLLLDPAAGDGEYSGHLPDGLGRLPALRCVKEMGWHAALAEPDPAAFASLAANAAPAAPGAVTLTMYGLLAPQSRQEPPQKRRRRRRQGRRSPFPPPPLPPLPPPPPAAALRVELTRIEAQVPDLKGRPLPAETRQRLEWGTAADEAAVQRWSLDRWQMDHLAGGPLAAALDGTNRSAAAVLRRCAVDERRTEPCWRTRLLKFNATMLPWHTLLDALGVTPAKHIDLLVLTLHDPSVEVMLRTLLSIRDGPRPSLLYFRHSYLGPKSSATLRETLRQQGYEVSAHSEVSAWGENSIAWRVDRCGDGEGMGTPMWWRAGGGG